MWWKQDSRLAKFLLILVGLGICGVGVVYFWSCKGVVDQMIGLMVMLVCGITGGVMLSPMISGWAGTRLGSGIYFKNDKLKRAPERLDFVRGLTEHGKYTEAAAELRLMLAQDFMDIEARMLLMRVYQEGLNEVTSTVETGREYFDHPGHKSNRESVEMLLHLSDLLPKDEATLYLQKELKRGKYSNYDRQIIKNRLEAIH